MRTHGLIAALVWMVAGSNAGAQVPQFAQVKVQSGDDIAWSLPAFDDRHWQDVQWTQVDPQQRLLWVRAHVSLPANAANASKPASLNISLLASSEVYWNGVRVGSNGVPAASRTGETPGLTRHAYRNSSASAARGRQPARDAHVRISRAPRARGANAAPLAGTRADTTQRRAHRPATDRRRRWCVVVRGAVLRCDVRFRSSRSRLAHARAGLAFGPRPACRGNGARRSIRISAADPAARSDSRLRGGVRRSTRSVCTSEVWVTHPQPHIGHRAGRHVRRDRVHARDTTPRL